MYKVNTNLVRKYAQRYSEMNMTATVRIDRPDVATLNASTGGVTSQVLKTVYEGKGRVSGVSGPVQYSLGEEPQYFSSGTVYVPLLDESGQPTTPQVNDVVVVTSHPDVLMVGRAFRVMNVSASGQFVAARELSVTGVQRWEAWTPANDIPSEWYV
jgi:hypothetical protein